MSNCAKFRENQTKTVGGVTIWRHTSRQTDNHQLCWLQAAAEPHRLHHNRCISTSVLWQCFA